MYSHGGPAEFFATTNQAELLEVPSIGGEYTCNNRHAGDAFVQSTLDRAFSNQEWVNLFPDVRVEFWFGSYSDHAIMIVSLVQI